MIGWLIMNMSIVIWNRMFEQNDNESALTYW